MTASCRVCASPLDRYWADIGVDVHPTCDPDLECIHGEPRGPRYCALCRRISQKQASGMQRALEADDVQAWKTRFAQAAERIAATGAHFTSEDVVDEVGLPRGETGMNLNNAVGAMMNALARKGVIVKTDERRMSKRSSSNGAELAVWHKPGLW